MTCPAELSIEAIFSPGSIAVVGATQTTDKAGGRTLAALVANGFDKPIYAVNPNRDEVQGIASFPSLEALPSVPDLIVLCVPMAAVEDLVGSACRIGVRAIVLFTSGFAEAGREGQAVQDRIAAMARRHGVAIVGPNCLGVISGGDRMAVSSTITLQSHRVRAGNVSFVSQSGAIATIWLDTILGQDLGISKWVSTGNEAVIGVTDILAYLVDDPGTRVIGMYVEGFRDGPALRRSLARAKAAGKPVIVLRAGRSSAGATAAASHTGALSGEDALNTALLDQYGAIQVESLSEMIDVARLCLAGGPTTGNRVAVVSLSGGAGALIADGLTGHGFDLPSLPAAVEQRLRAHFPSYITLGNPVDLSDRAVAHPDMFGVSVAALIESGAYDAIVTLMASRSPHVMDTVERATIALAPTFQGSFCNIWLATESALIDRLKAANIAVFTDIPPAINALAKAVKACRQPPRGIDAVPGTRPPRLTRQLAEHASKALLRDRAGLPVPDAILLEAERSDGLGSFGVEPVAVKLQSAELLHKSGNGAIELDVRGEAAALASAARMFAIGAERGLPFDGVLVEKMERIEHEFLIGLRHDPVLGPYLLVGRGGISVELDPDVTRQFLPLDVAAIEAMFRSLRCARLLDGFRGKAPVPVEQLVRVVFDLCELFLRDTDLAEIEINPIATLADDRVVAIDAAVSVYA